MNTNVEEFKDEIWKMIEGFPKYFISSNGVVISTYGNNKILKNCFHSADRPYAFVILQYKSESKNVYIHRLVAKAFLPNPDDLKVVHHKDRNTFNNRVENLKWVTHAENSYFAAEQSTTIKALSRSVIKEIREKYEYHGVFNTVRLAEEYGVNTSTIWRAVSGNSWKEV